MRFLKRGILTLLVIGGIAFGGMQSVNACSLTPNCYSVIKSVKCGLVPTFLQSSHECIHNNSYTHQCNTVQTKSEHTISCSGCKVVFSEEVRTCALTHTCDYCSRHGTASGLCQY